MCAEVGLQTEIDFSSWDHTVALGGSGSRPAAASKGDVAKARWLLVDVQRRSRLRVVEGCVMDA